MSVHPFFQNSTVKKALVLREAFLKAGFGVLEISVDIEQQGKNVIVFPKVKSQGVEYVGLAGVIKETTVEDCRKQWNEMFEMMDGQDPVPKEVSDVWEKSSYNDSDYIEAVRSYMAEEGVFLPPVRGVE